MKRSARGKKAGIVWRPVEYVLLIVIVLLVALLVWANREVQRETSRFVNTSNSTETADGISALAEQELQRELQLDAAYDSWERTHTAGVDSAADDIGGVFDETAY